MGMTYKENITAILECYFTGFKKEIIDSACSRILEQEPILDKIRAEMHATAEMHEDGDYYLREEWIDEIIDKYKAESELDKENENGNEG